MWAGWAPVGAEATSSGYDVAFYNASTGLFNIWSTDSNGNYITNLASGISATSTTLENFETIFQQGPQRRRHHRTAATSAANHDRYPTA